MAHRDPDRCAGAYSVDTEWRNRAEFVKGREAVREVGFVSSVGLLCLLELHRTAVGQCLCIMLPDCGGSTFQNVRCDVQSPI